MGQDLLLSIPGTWKFCTAAHNYSCYLGKPVPSYPHSFLQAGRMISDKIRYGRLFLIAQNWGKRKKYKLYTENSGEGIFYFLFRMGWGHGHFLRRYHLHVERTLSHCQFLPSPLSQLMGYGLVQGDPCLFSEFQDRQTITHLASIYFEGFGIHEYAICSHSN